MPGKSNRYSVLLDESSQLQVIRKSKSCKLCVIITLVTASVLALILAVALIASLSVGASHHIEKNECALSSKEKFDCLPGVTPSKDKCDNVGCCWEAGGSAKTSPKCFYGLERGYQLSGNYTRIPLGLRGDLKRRSRLQSSPHGEDLQQLRVEVLFETENRLHVKIYDPSTNRYEVPLETPHVDQKAQNTQYDVQLSNDTFSFIVTRKHSQMDIFKMAPGLVFADQFLQLSAYLPTSNIYGLGEHASSLRLPTNYTTLTMFTADVFPDPGNPGQNLYGVHPFYMCMEEDGNAHGVFLLNSNAMEVFLRPTPSITYRTIGGIIDLYIFMGPTPDSVVQQYIKVIGHPFMPPYWALGFHLCRWGYGSANNTWDVVRRMREHLIPHDTQWTDIDYMHDTLDFTYDEETYAELPSLVEDLHEHEQKYIIIIDPGISNTQPRGSYEPYDMGVEMDIFVKNSSNQLLVGRVWPNTTVYPDFTNPDIYNYWSTQIEKFHRNISFDGLWIDMNEPSNFEDGSIHGCPKTPLDSPPFLPGVLQANGILHKTLCMSAVQHVSTHYNVHSLYGFTETKATMGALQQVLRTRSLVISRSTYAGSGAYGGHWLGDNASKWKHLASSIPGILQFSLFGVPMVGADICGFFDNTTEELCTRWQQLGAFYPFSRNHNIAGANAQDPAVWSEGNISSIREALMLRYKLLPYLYTLFYSAHVYGNTVARPLFFEFPTDKQTWGLDTQFMWGSALLISPVLERGATSVRAYFPPSSKWYDLRNGTVIQSGYQNLTAPLSTIPVHIRGGSIILTQEPNTTTAASRRNPFSLLVAMNASYGAEGQAFIDDGVTIQTTYSGLYALITFQATQYAVTSTIENSGAIGSVNTLLEKVVVYGVDEEPQRVLLNDQTVPFTYTSDKVLQASLNVTAHVTTQMHLHWEV